MGLLGRRFWCAFSCALLTALSAPAVAAQDARPLPKPKPTVGRLLLWGGGAVPTRVVEAVAKIILAGRFVYVRFGRDASRPPWPTAPFPVERVTITTAAERDADGLATRLEAAAGIWIDGDAGSRKRLLHGSPLAAKLRTLFARGRLLGGHLDGLDCYPWLRVDGAFLKQDPGHAAVQALAAGSGRVGIAVRPQSCVYVGRRQVVVVHGTGAVTCLPASAHDPRRGPLFTTLDGGRRRIADLLQLCRAAIARRGPAWPPPKPPPIAVPAGTLIIHGGGGLDPSLVDLFIAKAGGPTRRFVIIPTAMGGRVDPQRVFMAQLLRRKGVQHVTVLQQRRRAQVESAAFQDAIRQASAIWFGGGRQWRLVDAFAGTSAPKLFHDLLARGGVIAGSSAGATIQGGYLVRGHPLGNTVQMAEGYERGLGFIPHVAIDQHFGQRDRYKDMSAWAKAFPQLLGFGIDEGTALVVEASVATVHGQFHVAVYNGHDPKDAGADYTELASGDRFDLRTRKRLRE